MEKSVSWIDIIEIAPVYNDLDKLGVVSFKIGHTDYNFILKIKFPETDFFVLSNSSRIRHILCDGNPPKKSKGLNISECNSAFASLYPNYAEFLRLVKKKSMKS
jgi:hypothetical protein